MKRFLTAMALLMVCVLFGAQASFAATASTPTMNVWVEKRWLGIDDGVSRTAAFTLIGGPTPIEFTITGNGSASFPGLPAYDEQGNQIDYQIVEHGDDGGSANGATGGEVRIDGRIYTVSSHAIDLVEHERPGLNGRANRIDTRNIYVTNTFARDVPTPDPDPNPDPTPDPDPNPDPTPTPDPDPTPNPDPDPNPDSNLDPGSDQSPDPTPDSSTHGNGGEPAGERPSSKAKPRASRRQALPATSDAPAVLGAVMSAATGAALLAGGLRSRRKR